MTDKTKSPQEKGWKSWNDFLGVKGNKEKSSKISEALKDLKTNWKTYSKLSDEELRGIFKRKGLFKSKDPYVKAFFNKLKK